MKRNDLLFVIAVVAVVGFLYYLSTTGKKPPFIPADAQHMATATNEDCAGCHGKDKQYAIKGPHPPKEQCLTCHKYK